MVHLLTYFWDTEIDMYMQNVVGTNELMDILEPFNLIREVGPLSEWVNGETGEVVFKYDIY